MRWNLLDEVIEINRGRTARTLASWPRDTLRTELLFLEMMAQTAGLVFGSLDDFKTDIVFAKVDEVRFHSMTPSHLKLTIQAVAEDIRPEGGWFQAHVISENISIAQARLLLANAGHLKPDFSGSVTFHSDFMRHYCVREKVTLEGTLR